MDYAVCIKQVPAISEGDMDERTGNLIRSGLGQVCNPCDLSALEAGIRMKRQMGGTVTVFSMGPDSARSVLMDGVARGADRGVLISDPALSGADVPATAYTLAQTIKSTGQYPCVLTGNHTTDGDTGFVGAALAQCLSYAYLSGVKSIVTIEEDGITVICERTGYTLRMKALFPCVISVEPGVAAPAIPTFSGRIKAGKMDFAKIGVTDLEDTDASHYGSAGSATKVKRIYPPVREKKTAVQVADGGTAASMIWEKLHG